MRVASPYVAQSGDSPLHVAAYYRHAGVMKVLLEQGANVAATTTVVSRREQVHCHDSAADACAYDQAKEQALHIAAKAGSASCVGQLLNHGATVNAQTVVCTPRPSTMDVHWSHPSTPLWLTADLSNGTALGMPGRAHQGSATPVERRRRQGSSGQCK